MIDTNVRMLTIYVYYVSICSYTSNTENSYKNTIWEEFSLSLNRILSKSFLSSIKRPDSMNNVKINNNKNGPIIPNRLISKETYQWTKT